MAADTAATQEPLRTRDERHWDLRVEFLWRNLGHSLVHHLFI